MSKCKSCKFFKDNGSGSPDECARYPKHLLIMANHYCGEFQSTPKKEPAALEGWVYGRMIYADKPLDKDYVHVRILKD